MSLTCNNCNRVTGPTDDLPGKESVMIYANVLSLIWTTEKSAKKKWTLHYTRAPFGFNLCFRCITSKFAPARKSALNSVYDAYKAEIEYRRVKESREGILFSGAELQNQKGTYDFYEEWKAKQKLIPAKCIFCNANLPDNRNPYFTAVVMDRVYCEKKLTQFFSEINYSWSDFRTGWTTFLICFDCLKKNFYSTFEDLSCGLRGIQKQTSPKATKPELKITPEFLKRLKNDVGGERAKELLKEISATFEPKIAIEITNN